MQGDARARGRVWLVGAGPGQPDLITWRGVELLRRADVVLHDALSHPGLLELCSGAELIDVGKRYGARAMPQPEITRLLVELSREPRRIVRLKGGDPLLFARGAEEALALAEAGVPFEVVPGITAATAAAAFAGFSLTHRDLSSSVTLITGSDREGKEWSPAAWQKLATATGTICVYMGLRRVAELTAAVIDGGRPPTTPALAVQWVGRPEQRTVVGTLANLAERVAAAGLGSPALLVIGEVVELRARMSWFENKPLFGRRILLARPERQRRESEAAIRERGAECLAAPAIELSEPEQPQLLDRALLAAGSYDWVLFTSANGVHASFAALERLGRDARVFGGARLGAIGPRTAAALSAGGLRADLVAEEFVAEGLLRDLVLARERGEPLCRVLLLRAAEAREALPEGLAREGAEVEVVAAYRAKAVVGEARERLIEAASRAEIVLFTSSSMVDSVVAALGAESRAALAGKIVACIGPITAARAREQGLTVEVEAATYTLEGALDALERYFEARRQASAQPDSRSIS